MNVLTFFCSFFPFHLCNIQINLWREDFNDDCHDSNGSLSSWCFSDRIIKNKRERMDRKKRLCQIDRAPPNINCKRQWSFCALLCATHNNNVSELIKINMAKKYSWKNSLLHLLSFLGIGLWKGCWFGVKSALFGFSDPC